MKKFFEDHPLFKPGVIVTLGSVSILLITLFGIINIINNPGSSEAYWLGWVCCVADILISILVRYLVIKC